MKVLGRGCIVPVDGPARPCRYEGGRIFDEVFGDRLADYTLIDRQVQAYVGDTSVIDGEPINWRVTDERNRIRIEAGEEPHAVPICGTVLLLGIDLSSGEIIDLPKDWMDALVRGGRLGWIGA